MSYTEIQIADKTGRVSYSCGESKNSHRFFSFVQQAIERKYLPSYPKPKWLQKLENNDEYNSRLWTCPISRREDDEHPAQEIWDLIEDKRLSRNERIVLGFTFDHSWVFKKNKKQLIDALRAFDIEVNNFTSCNEIANIIESDKEAIAYHAVTSITGGLFAVKYDEETDEEIYYNLFTGTEHFDLFKELKNIEKTFHTPFFTRLKQFFKCKPSN